MDEDDLTLSDVHVGRESVATEISDVVMTRFLVKNPANNESKKDAIDKSKEAVNIDEDGDLVLDRQTSEVDSDVIYIYHAMSTKLKDVGLQVWAGCLLLCDFITAHPHKFCDKSILELGAGTGLASIVAAREAKHVFCTDIGEEVLRLCQHNVEANDMTFGSLNKVTVKELDWYEKPVAGSGKFEWSSLDLENLNEAEVILAADVIYSQGRTIAFFETIKSLGRKLGKCDIYIALEQRLNFTLIDMDVSCPAYNYFLQKIQDLICEDSSCDLIFKVRQEPTNFPQYFEYDRTKYLELWYISSEPKPYLEKENG